MISYIIDIYSSWHLIIFFRNYFFLSFLFKINTVYQKINQSCLWRTSSSSWASWYFCCSESTKFTPVFHRSRTNRAQSLNALSLNAQKIYSFRKTPSRPPLARRTKTFPQFGRCGIGLVGGMALKLCTKERHGSASCCSRSRSLLEFCY